MPRAGTGLLRELRERFGDRVRESGGEPDSAGYTATVLPAEAGEVRELSAVAAEHGVPLVAQGAGTGVPEETSPEGVLVRFDLMRRTRLPGDEETWVEAEPGALWLSLDNELRLEGRGLAVYPTSAPRATVGGWLATDGLGVGSFCYGWTSENVLSAEVAAEGELREVGGEELRGLLSPGGGGGIIVRARLRTRRASSDRPFAVELPGPQELVEAIEAVRAEKLPLWHLGFVDPEMSRARRLGEEYVLYGAYAAERYPKAGPALTDLLENAGRPLPEGGALRVWGERFFPSAPGRRVTVHRRDVLPFVDLPRWLSELPKSPGTLAQGTLGRDGDALGLVFELPEGG